MSRLPGRSSIVIAKNGNSSRRIAPHTYVDNDIYDALTQQDNFLAKYEKNETESDMTHKSDYESAHCTTHSIYVEECDDCVKSAGHYEVESCDSCMTIEQVEELVCKKSMKVVSRIVESSGGKNRCKFLHVKTRYGVNVLIQLDKEFLCSARPKYDFVATRTSKTIPVVMKDMLHSSNYEHCESFAMVCCDNVCVASMSETSNSGKYDMLNLVTVGKKSKYGKTKAAVIGDECPKIYPVVKGQVLYASMDEIDEITLKKMNEIHGAVVKEVLCDKLQHVIADLECSLQFAKNIAHKYNENQMALTAKYNELYQNAQTCIIEPDQELCDAMDAYQDAVFSILDRITFLDSVENIKRELKKVENCCDDCCRRGQ